MSGLGTVGGFFYPFRGLRFLGRHPRLLGIVAIPVAVNALLFSLLVWFAGSRFDRWLEALLPRGEGWWWTLAYWALWVLGAAVLLVVVLYTFALVGNLILAPFNDLLSDRVERIYMGQTLEEPFRLGAFVRDLGRSFKAELGRIALYLSGFACVLALNFIPALGTAASAVLAPALAFFFLGWEYLDYSMERWHLPFGAKRRTVFRNTPAIVAFGCGVWLLLMIPVLNLLAIPVCVAGGTLLFCDLKNAGRVELPAPSARPGVPPQERDTP